MRTVSLLHPFPSAVNAAAVAAIALIAGGTAASALLLSLGMLLIQFSIGAANDVFDIAADRRTKPDKPLVRGDVSRTSAAVTAGLLAVAGLVLAATQGIPELLLLGLMYSAGIAYDAGLKGRGLGWAAYAVAFPLLPAYAWFGAVGALPPRYALLLPIAVLAGPTLALANGLVDHDRDRAARVRTVVVRVGPRAAWRLMVAGSVVVYGVALLSVRPCTSVAVLAALAGAGLLAVIGAVLSGSASAAQRERGWRVQAIGVALLTGAWFLGDTFSSLRT